MKSIMVYKGTSAERVAAQKNWEMSKEDFLSVVGLDRKASQRDIQKEARRTKQFRSQEKTEGP